MSVTAELLGAAQIAARLGQHAPTPEQAAVIEAPLEPLLVVAGAGSGKTETMSARVVHLIANGLVEPDRILGLTFTRKAAGELSDRVRRRLRMLRRRGIGADGSALVAPTISTYNSYASGLVGDHALRLGIEPGSRLLGEAARWQLAYDVVEHWAVDLGLDLAPSTVTAAVLDLAGALGEHLCEPEALRAEAERLVEVLVSVPPGDRPRAGHRTDVDKVVGSLRDRAALVDLVVEFTARKRAHDLVDFSDQVAIAARLAQEVPEVGRAERDRFAVVLLDEYQDTSVAQLQLLGHLFGGAGDGLGHAVTAVGDPHQSIYGWRGASAGGLERFPDQFPARTADGTRPARVLALSTSWRNDHAVLAAANVVAGPLRDASRAVDLPVLAARPGARGGEVAVAMHATVEEEARAVAEFVATRRALLTARREGQAAPDDGGPEPVTAAVLCRKRSQFGLLDAALREAGLPVEVVGLGGLLSTPEVVDLVAALEVVHDPARGDSLMRLLTGPRLRLGAADLVALGDWAGEQVRRSRRAAERRDRSTEPAASGQAEGSTATAPTQDPPHPEAGRAVDDRDGSPGGSAPEPDVVDDRSIVDALDELPPAGWTSARGRSLSGPGRARLAELSAVLRALRQQAFLPVVDLVAETERMLGLDIEVAAVPGRGAAAARANLDAFRAVAASFSDSADVTGVGAFLAWLDAAQTEERGLEAPVAEMDPAAVQLLTVHASKGLEWDVVAVPGLVEGTFPDKPKTHGWITERGSLPTTLRGDRDNLPELRLSGVQDLADLHGRLETFKVDNAAHLRQEERRLAYVAVTRARSHLLLTGSWWRDGSRPTTSAPFLEEVAESEPVAAAEPIRVKRLAWAPSPTDDAAGQRPVKPEVPEVDPPTWPIVAPLGVERTARVGRAARAVLAALARDAQELPGSSPGRQAGADGDGTAGPGRQAGGDGDGTADLDDLGDLAHLEGLVEVLLAERRRRRAERSSVTLPAHLSASAVVRLADDREQFARQLRRPVPTAPSVHARRGTAFHAWVEQWYGRAALVDLDALPGADDDSSPLDPVLADLQRTFLESEWAGRTPLAIEVDVETPVGGLVVRSRIDAVFPEPDGGVVVVDWKTGRPPTDPAALRTRELQLALYRLAWARWRGLPLEQVRAGFYYVGSGETLRPAALPDVDELEEVIRGGTWTP
ncbi:DNA helicase [Actinotalea ferrariae CF5-4]|uniref:DNA 3'-5' helicase n=1 Tax=Actinotalea ferrariae CF5-4 TaxID=948458 RepID=A0A021VQL7_9CELL|nr:ATP-dependent DNA helicase [Actinotalea ferrariae]EYR63413.1 DNA helicase [Actinotalea ferrariae CF5-4]